MARLRIVFITPEFLPVRGGTSVYSINLIKHLLSSDVEVHLVTTKRGNIEAERDFEYLDDHRLHIYRISESHDDLYSHIRFQFAVAKLLRNLDIRPDLIHSNFPVQGDNFHTLFSNSNIPVITSIHGFASMLKDTIKASLNHTPKDFLDASERAILYYQPIFTFLEKLYLKKVTHAIAVSEYTARLASEYIPSNKISIVYHGVDTSLFNNNNREDDEPIALFLSRFAAHKGIYVLLKALELVFKEMKNIKILIGGNTDNRFVIEYVKNFANGNVNFIGYVPNYTELPLLYSKANIFVSSSFEDLLGFRLLEAMSCKLVTIATNVGGVPELIKDGENGLLVDAGDHKMLADRMIMLAQDKTLRKRLSLNARTTIQTRFTSEMMAKNTLNVYYNVLNNIRSKH